MKIVALQAENLKRLQAVEIKPDGNLVEIAGKNGAGKTSILDAIAWALEGATHIQSEPIRKGWTEAVIHLDLGKLKVTRTFKAKDADKRKAGEPSYTTSIKVENEDGARYGSPQAMLDALVGELAFDPLAFTRMKPADQFETLKSFVPGVDFAAIEEANKADYTERTAVNRRAKEAETQASGIIVPLDAPQEQVDETALVTELEAAGKHNAELEQRKARREDAQRRVDENLQRARQLRIQAEELIEEAASLEGTYNALAEQIAKAAALPAPIDTAPIRTKIAEAKRANERFVAAKHARIQKADLEALAERQRTRSAELTKAMEDRATAKAKAIAEAEMPVGGITFGDGAIELNGVPFDQASDAEQLRASIAIAAAMNPKLRVIRVRDGSLLDEDAMAMLARFADEHDMQVWVERVASDSPIGFVIEDGQVKSSPKRTPPQPDLLQQALAE